MAVKAKYEKLSENEPTEDEEHLVPPQHSVDGIKRSLFYSLLVVLLVSNISWLYYYHHSLNKPSSHDKGRSRYANLPRDQPVALGTHSPYTDKNVTLRNQVWDAINIDAGMIAVPDSFVVDKDLPGSQRFVWDQSKSVYLLNGHHTLHCVRAVYISLMEFAQQQPQSRRWEHVLHCVDQLRQEALCNADDTPRFSTSDDVPVSGMGQVRMCRSWDKLEEWARQYNACYRYVNQTASYKDFPQIERFVWCPEGSPYRKEVEKVFGRVEW